MSVNYNNPVIDNVTGSPNLDSLKTGSDKVNEAFEQISTTLNAADDRYMRRSNNLSDILNATTARNNLGLGTAATRNVMTSLTDTTTPDALMPRGAFGVGISSTTHGLSLPDSSFNSNLPVGFYGPNSAINNQDGRPAGENLSWLWSAVVAPRNNGGRTIYLTVHATVPRHYIGTRSGSTGAVTWQELYHTGNLGESDTAWTTVTSLQNGWAGTVRYIKRGGMVTVVLDMTTSTRTASPILVLPVNYRPAFNMLAAAFDSTITATRLLVRSNGSVEVFPRDGGGVQSSITYPALP